MRNNLAHYVPPPQLLSWLSSDDDSLFELPPMTAEQEAAVEAWCDGFVRHDRGLAGARGRVPHAVTRFSDGDDLATRDRVIDVIRELLARAEARQ